MNARSAARWASYMDVASNPAGYANFVVRNKLKVHMVGVAQLVERWIVAPEVAGSSPVTHPIFYN